MAHDAGKQEPPSLDEFSNRLNAMRGDKEIEKPSKQREGAQMGQGLRVASELLAALLVAGGIGWGLDQLFGTKPWLLIMGVFLGFAAGLINVSRAMTKMDRDSSDDGSQDGNGTDTA
ncbi:MAG: AtpZ/AtpI family protein [Pseudomonadota bacterium]